MRTERLRHLRACGISSIPSRKQSLQLLLLEMEAIGDPLASHLLELNTVLVLEAMCLVTQIVLQFIHVLLNNRALPVKLNGRAQR